MFASIIAADLNNMISCFKLEHREIICKFNAALIDLFEVDQKKPKKYVIKVCHLNV